MTVACWCGAVLQGRDIVVCPQCARPVEWPTRENPSGLRMGGDGCSIEAFIAAPEDRQLAAAPALVFGGGDGGSIDDFRPR